MVIVDLKLSMVVSFNLLVLGGTRSTLAVYDLCGCSSRKGVPTKSFLPVRHEIDPYKDEPVQCLPAVARAFATI